MEEITKETVSQYQKRVVEAGLDKETLKFLKETKEFFEKNNIMPKEFGYQSGISFSPSE